MTYTKCPICGAIAHLNVSDARQWYATHYPDVPEGSLVPGKCIACSQELQEGDTVVVRQCFIPEAIAKPGMRGTVTAVLSSPEHGTIYEVTFNDSTKHHFIRAELRKAPVGSPKRKSTRTSGTA